jgi:hypothetical protein
VTITRDFTGDAGPRLRRGRAAADPERRLVVNLTAGAAAVVGNLTTIAFPE